MMSRVSSFLRNSYSRPLSAARPLRATLGARIATHNEASRETTLVCSRPHFTIANTFSVIGGTIHQKNKELKDKKLNLIKLSTGLDNWRDNQGNRKEDEIVKDRIIKAFKNESETLDLSHLKLKTLPKELELLAGHLKVLYLHNNNLNELPESVYCLRRLERLYLQNNELSGLSTEIEGLSNLKVLYLHKNPIMDLTHELIGRLPVERLYLPSKLKFPDKIGGLSRLDGIICHNMGFTVYLKETSDSKPSSSPHDYMNVFSPIGMYLY
jgi:Leucine-rich repeat (LRR) protein